MHLYYGAIYVHLLLHIGTASKAYDHAKSKGQQFVSNLQEINAQTHTRFKEECEKTKSL